MLYRISVTERGLTGIANIFRSRLSRLDDLLGAGTVPLTGKHPLSGLLGPTNGTIVLKTLPILFNNIVFILFSENNYFAN